MRPPEAQARAAKPDDRDTTRIDTAALTLLNRMHSDLRGRGVDPYNTSGAGEVRWERKRPRD